MLVTTKPILGEVTAITISSTNLEKSLKFYEQLGLGRYSVAIFLFLVMATVPMKMYLRWIVPLRNRKDYRHTIFYP